MKYAEHLSSTTPQSQPLAGQVPNSAGGYSFEVSKWTRLDRFLVLGSEGGSYYATERKMTIDSAKCIEACLADDGRRVVRAIEAVSIAGRAPKNDPALVALAIALKKGDKDTRKAAMRAVPQIARTGTHLFHLAEFVKALGGWGRLTMLAFARWYAETPVDRLALQAIKYQERDGWSHRDILRKSHPHVQGTEDEPQRQAIWDWMVNGWPSIGERPHPDETLVKIWAFERAKTARGAELLRLIEEYSLPHECVPNEAKNDPKVWAAMLPSMGLTAIIRNLGKMTAVGLLAPLSAATSLVAEQLVDVERLTRNRVHPMMLLVALKTYAQGHGEKGKLTWSANSRIVNALDAAFYAAFKAVEPTGKRHLLAVDTSGSMDDAKVTGMSISAREGAAAMSLVTANVEPDHHFVGFTSGPYRSRFPGHGSGLRQLSISPRSRLDDVVKAMSMLPFGGTDCALPMIWAAENKVPVDVFCVYTDSETWAGDVHPKVALERYRQKTGIGAKLVVVGMVANEFSIADPADAGMLDVFGFDTATPGLISDFARQ